MPYRYRELRAEAATRDQNGESAERLASDRYLSHCNACVPPAVRRRPARESLTAPATYENTLTGPYLRVEYVEARRSAADIAEEVG